MKIGIIGNMNNMYFALARYLADRGYACELLLYDDEPAHFHPSADTFETRFSVPVKQLNWGNAAHFLQTRKLAAADLQGYDFLIGNGPAPAFAWASGRKLDLFIPYGNDLYSLPFVQMVHPVRQLSYLTLAWYQRKGIQQCPFLLMDKTNVNFDQVFRKLDYRGKRIICPPPLLYYKEYQTYLTLHEEENQHMLLLKVLRKDNELLVLQHIRQSWKLQRDKWSRKGNDKAIKGFALFVKQNPKCKVKLVLLEYGHNVEQSKQLIAALGISDYVIWFPKMLRKHLMSFIAMSDVVIGELHHSWNTYCVVMETLFMGKPLIHNRSDSYFSDAYQELYPMFGASSAETVCDALQAVADNKKAAAEMGAKGQEWFHRYCVDLPLQKISSLIEQKQTKSNVQASFS